MQLHCHIGLITSALWFRRLTASARTLPGPLGWVHTGAAIAAMAAVCLPVGFASGFLKPRKSGLGWCALLQHSAAAFVCPALVEEAMFRAALLPHPAVDPPAAFTPAAFARSAAGPLVAFIAYHLANPNPQSRAVFYDWRFLSLAGGLGAACTAAHWATGGSLLAAAVVHWLPVCVWLFGLDGLQRLHGAIGKEG